MHSPTPRTHHEAFAQVTASTRASPTPTPIPTPIHTHTRTHARTMKLLPRSAAETRASSTTVKAAMPPSTRFFSVSVPVGVLCSSAMRQLSSRCWPCAPQMRSCLRRCVRVAAGRLWLVGEVGVLRSSVSLQPLLAVRAPDTKLPSWVRVCGSGAFAACGS